MTNDINTDKIDEAVLALLSLTIHEENEFGGARTWKGHDWDVLNRLHEQGMISNPKGKAKSVMLTVDGLKRSRELFEQLFTNKD